MASAPRSGRGGRGFESHHSDHFNEWSPEMPLLKPSPRIPQILAGSRSASPCRAARSDSRKFTLLLLSMLAVLAPEASAADILPPGHRPTPYGVHALVGGTVVTAPGKSLKTATIVIRDGMIEDVGANVKAPSDARIWKMEGTTIYAGMIDPYFLPDSGKSESGESSSADGLTSGSINFLGVAGDEKDQGGTGPSYQLSSVAPERRVAAGFTPNASAWKGMRAQGFTAANLAPEKGIFRGSSSFVTLGDGDPNEMILLAELFQHVAFEKQGGDDRVYPASLMGVIAVIRQTLFDTLHYAQDWAAYNKEATVRRRPEYNPALDKLARSIAGKRTFMIEPRSALMVDRAGRLLKEFDLDAILVASGEEWRRPDLVRKASKRFVVPVDLPKIPKMPNDDDWDAISLDNLRRWDWAAENPALLKRSGAAIALTTFGLSERKDFRKNVALAVERGLSETDALAALTTVPAEFCRVSDRLGTIEKGKIANLTIVAGDSYFDSDDKIREVWVDGRIFPVEPPKVASKTKKKAAPKKGKEADEEAAKKKAEAEKKKADVAKRRKKRAAKAPLSGRGVLASPKHILIKNATVWTCGPEGKLDYASLLISDGRIQQVGHFKAELAAGTLVIDAKGRHVTPGLVDCHSHSMILGGVNEGTLPSTSMVRVGDVVNSETSNIYRQLAGGLTVANLLHGSANPIGGQNAVIKLRDGASPEELKFKEAPGGIKFALGENVKQSNWGDEYTTRFPQTRMGVRTFFANRFTAAEQYLARWNEFEKKGGVKPRRDLELEALGEIINGDRWIHCHSYRQDEILVFLRTMEEFGVTVGTLQHVLEGYKVADEIARHGAGASAFSDWWAYKFEVYDAIPYAGTLMHRRGALVSFNSDSSDVARRMNLEAAKAVKYGGLPEEDALKFVTLNPAKQLRIDAYVGSLEKGKHADFVIWSDNPLSTRAVCEQTWIEGKKYFDYSLSDKRAAILDKERKALLVKVKKLAELNKKSKGDEDGDSKRAAFFRRALETMNDLGGGYSCCDHHKFLGGAR